MLKLIKEKLQKGEILGISPNATKAEIRSAFRRLIQQWHPDKNPGDAASEVKFKEIAEAYDVLKDSDKRAADAERAHAGVNAITDGIPLGQPILVGHHSEKRADAANDSKGHCDITTSNARRKIVTFDCSCSIFRNCIITALAKII